MSTELQIAILGIIGTMGGTILGWFLNNISQSGKLNIFISSWEDEFDTRDEIGGMVKSSSIEKTEHYSYRATMDLYNSSGETKIMRNIEIIFAKDKIELKNSIPKNDATKTIIHTMVIYDNIEPINIPPKSVKKIAVHNGFGKESLNFIWQTNNIFLRYVNEKNRIKIVPIKNENYKDYFNNDDLD